MFLFVIPVNDRHCGKSRLRKSFTVENQQYIDDLQQALTNNVINVLSGLNNAKIIVLTPDVDLKMQLALPCTVVHDKFRLSTLSLNNEFEYLVNKFRHTVEGIFFLMSDLPFLSSRNVTYISNILQKQELTLVVAEKDRGTSGIFLSQKFLQSKITSQFFFGFQSSIAFINYFQHNQLEYKLVNDNDLGFDLDTIDDVITVANADSHPNKALVEMCRKLASLKKV